MKEPGARPGFCTLKELLLFFHLAGSALAALMIFSLLPRNIHELGAGEMRAGCSGGLLGNEHQYTHNWRLRSRLL